MTADGRRCDIRRSSRQTAARVNSIAVTRRAAAAVAYFIGRPEPILSAVDTNARLAILLIGLLGSACSSGARVDVRRFPLTGVVIGRQDSPPRVTVAHEAIAGVMPAMSMAFEIDPSTPLLKVGDRIAATLVVSPDRSWIEEVTVTGAMRGDTMRPATPSRAIPGAIVPDLRLIDQNGAATTLRDAAGRVQIITFLYTRCPLPDMCPLMLKHLEAVRERANDDGLGARLALLGITVDPEFDTPAVLRAYGRSMLRGTNPFEQWTLAMGTARQIEEVARFFGVGYQPEGGVVTHTLSTAVVSHDGRVMQTFAANAWRPEELYDVVRRGIERAAVR